MIVIPALLTSRAAIAEHVERLEVHYLANADAEFYFALLTDWMDSGAEISPADEDLLTVAANGIADLNRRYGSGPTCERFLLLHRRRLWNDAQCKWMGWERKRGKLHEFNRLLRGAADTTFMSFNGGTVIVPDGVRYVITLDADTLLPRGAAKKLVGKMAHPLNRPALDARTSRVVEGYAILQPRITLALPMIEDESLFHRVFSGTSGIDPYASVISDVYQDLFAEGTYYGKGIYDVDVFEEALAGRIPDNTLLSHDLLEGIYARAGLVSDIEVVEEFPSRYDVSAARQRRWARGDWQLLPWIFGYAPRADTNRESLGIPPLGRWKMLDNLRRQLLAPTCIVVLLAGWTLPFASAWIWTGVVVGAIALPALLPFLTRLFPHRYGMPTRAHFRALGADLVLALLRTALRVSLLAHQAWMMGDAILRTLFRLFVSRRNLLEWLTAAQSKSRDALGTRGFYREMASALLLAAFTIILVGLGKPASWPIAAPFVLLWILSPTIAWRISLPPKLSGRKRVSASEARSLRLTARQTWSFFETFVTAADHMLPPDNFQEEPSPVVAHRTSPTNIGLYLLSVVTARDFGWLGTVETLERLEATLKTMNGLERFRGHFYNWYDTASLRPLDPKYVSCVDSGNLAGHLLAIANVCQEIAASPIVGLQWAAGTTDAIELARETLGELRKGTLLHAGGQVESSMETALGILAARLHPSAATPAATAERIAELLPAVSILRDNAEGFAANNLANDSAAATLAWIEAVQACLLSQQRDLDYFAPWATLLESNGRRGTTRHEDSDAVPDDEYMHFLGSTPTLSELPDLCAAAVDLLSRQREAAVSNLSADANELVSIDSLISNFQRSGKAALEFKDRLAGLRETALRMFSEMRFDFLYEPQRQLLSIGYRVNDGTLDPDCYDLLASEARLASFVAIAKGDVPTRHWFRLGRTLTSAGGGAALISWSGSMFEYLMPSLIMHARQGSLLGETIPHAVKEQIDYASNLGVPWGASESAYSRRDLEYTYQYSSFGTPSLGLKRGLAENLVIAPYATALAAMVDPKAAVLNFARLALIGAQGKYGWYEALDYTPARLPDGTPVAVVRAYMAHHQAMSLIAIGNTLLNDRMRARFHAEPIVQATELLLQERASRNVEVSRVPGEGTKPGVDKDGFLPSTTRIVRSPNTRTPRTHLLSNGKYALMITAAGSGYTRWKGNAITRWREDTTRDDWGAYIFLRDKRNGQVWSAAYQPTGAEPDRYEATFSEGRAEIARRDGTLSTNLEIAVSAEDDADVRRVSITNHGKETRQIEVTSYSEIVLATEAADTAHPAFSKLFVQTEFEASANAILATRRRRSEDEAEIWAAQTVVVEGETIGELEFETDRARFLGRGLEIGAPAAVGAGAPLSGTTGAVLDPIFSLRRSVKLKSGMTARIAFWTAVAPSRQGVLELIDKHREAAAFDRATALAWTQAQMQLHHLGIDAGDAHIFQRLASSQLYSDPTLRPPSEVLERGMGAQALLWRYGISGDLPIVLVKIQDAGDLEIVRRLLLAHEYWQMKQLSADLVILNERPASYAQELQQAMEVLVAAHQSRPQLKGEAVKGAVFVLRADQIPEEARNLLQSVARAVFSGHKGTLSSQLRNVGETKDVRSTPKHPHIRDRQPQTAAPTPLQLEFSNGLGGFADEGREYVSTLRKGSLTPTPWLNVISNSSFGFQTSVEGSGYTWAIDSQQNRLTPWSNDPVSDRPGEAIYIRDEISGALWTPTALPIRDLSGSYQARHGQGYSRFHNVSHEIAIDLLQYVPIGDPIKISRLTITNLSNRTRRLSVTGYVEWVLGASRTTSAPFILTGIDQGTGAMFAENPWNSEFGSRVAFADLRGEQTSWTGDRAEFLGRNGRLDNPEALVGSTALSNRTGGGLDPCGALQTKVELKANATAEIVFFIGQAASREEARSLVLRYRSADLDAALRDVGDQWNRTLGTIQVTTPDRSMDVLINSWLLYQTLACRVWARSGFYQSSGAYGFRDQLQDVLALCATRPDVAREHLLRAAGRQFIEGDVQHWWAPNSGRGIRTRISDDRVWLAYAAAQYVKTTGDQDFLNEKVPFLGGPILKEGEQEAFFDPEISGEEGTVFEHCARALDGALQTGVHGLPLMGTGDWNDGMNRVGAGGKGESVWLGWLLCDVLPAFADRAHPRGEHVRAAAWRDHAAALKDALEGQAWDGEWYRRAFFDDGTPLGTSHDTECRIDAIAQSWSVLSGAAAPERAEEAMASLDRLLIKREERLHLLLTAPFDQSPRDPGYIKGYPPGIRENGGQYTHGALWSVAAFATLGDGDKAVELFSLINPINHSHSPASVEIYKVEPYAACADIYSMPPHVGRGGWTWYTGSAAWMYRAAVEWILGFRLEGDTLVLDPCIPKAWPHFEIEFRYRATQYSIRVENPSGLCRGVALGELDGKQLAGDQRRVPLLDDGVPHRVRIVLGSATKDKSIENSWERRVWRSR